MTLSQPPNRLAALLLGSFALSTAVVPAIASTPLRMAAAPQAAAGKDHDHDHSHDHDHGSLEKGKHVHGEVTFNIALDGELLTVELDAPAINVIGFEKSPRTDAERQAVAAVDAWLAGGRDIAAVPRNAACRLASVAYTPPQLGTGHADYRARHSFRCTNAAALEWVELWALRRLTGVERAEANVITPTVQRQQELTGGALRVSLK